MLLKNNSVFCNGCKIGLRLELKPHVKTTYMFRQIEILVLDKIRMLNIVRIALRGWFKTAYYVFAKKTTLYSCPEGLCFIRSFSTYFLKYEKGFSFLQTALPFWDLIAGSHTFCHSALNSVNL